MSLPDAFWERLSHRSDAELYDMLAHQENYEPEAIAAAKGELAKRNVSAEQIAKFEFEVQSDKSAIDPTTVERLSWPMRILLFFLCAGIGCVVMGIYYHTKGYPKKARDCWVTFACSVVFHFLVLLGAIVG